MNFLDKDAKDEERRALRKKIRESERLKALNRKRTRESQTDAVPEMFGLKVPPLHDQSTNTNRVGDDKSISSQIESIRGFVADPTVDPVSMRFGLALGLSNQINDRELFREAFSLMIRGPHPRPAAELPAGNVAENQRIQPME